MLKSFQIFFGWFKLIYLNLILRDLVWEAGVVYNIFEIFFPPGGLYREFGHFYVKTMTSWGWKEENVLAIDLDF